MKSIILTSLICFTLSFAAFGQTGINVPQMSACDGYVQNFINTYNIQGLSIAIAKDGKLVYHRGFGSSNIGGTEPVYPYNLFRIASIYKPVTSIAIMKLYQDGFINMNDNVLELVGF